MNDAEEPYTQDELRPLVYVDGVLVFRGELLMEDLAFVADERARRALEILRDLQSIC